MQSAGAQRLLTEFEYDISTQPTEAMSTANVDHAEINKFSKTANEWWNTNGEFRTLHQVNPFRLDYIQKTTPVANKKVLDVGCGGGILSEALCREGALVTGIDMSEQAIEAAKSHMQISELQITYLCKAAEQFAEKNSNQFDIITCMELIEHIPNPLSLIEACSHMLKQGGHLFLSTLNRTPKSWLFGIVAAEHILNLLPRGTHQYRNFVRPSELFDWCEQSGLSMQDITGLHYNPLSNSFRLGPGVDINYFVRCQKT